MDATQARTPRSVSQQPLSLSQLGQGFAIRFWAKVDKDGSIPADRPDLGPCWIWLGERLTNGYGRVRRRGRHIEGQKNFTAHRVAYQLARGPIPSGLEPDHLCRVRNCANPSHLELVTHKVNCLRGISFTAQHARQTHCINGHEFTLENTTRIISLSRGSKRRCKTCHRERSMKYYWRDHPCLAASP